MARSGVLKAALLWLVCWGHIASLPAIRASEEPPLQSESSLPTRLVEQMQELLGLRSLLLNQAMPSGVARIFAARSSSQSATLSGVNFTTLMRTTAGQQGQGSSVQANPMAAALQEAIDAAQLGVVGNALNLVSGITYTVSGALSTVASALGIIVADWARQSGRAQYPLSAYSFFQVLYGNLNAEIDGSDYLGDAAKYIKLYNQLQAELSSGQMASDMQGQMAQMAAAGTLLQAVSASMA